MAPAKRGGHVELYVLLVSEVLDHDAHIANMLLNQVLVHVRQHPQVNFPAVRALWLVSDCGPHFRSYESAAHYLFILVKTMKVKVHVLYLGEQHGKGARDRLFGWTNDWLQQYIQTNPVHGIAHLLQAYKQGSSTMMQRDPAGPIFLVHEFDPGMERPSERFSLSCPTLKISRTYSLTGELNEYASSGVTIKNHVFSDLISNESLHPWTIEKSVAEEDVPWRRGYYDKPRSWEEIGPQAGDVTELSRKYAAQKNFFTESMPNPKRSLEEKLSAKAQALSKQARKRKRQMVARGRGSASAQSTSSTSSSSSTSSDSSSSET